MLSTTKNVVKRYYDAKRRIHRKNGPAVEWPNGTKEWYQHGELHREDGPAREYADGEKQWYLNDKRHRTDGPAVERAEGTKAWWLNGKLHREDGPAIVRADGSEEWYLNGIQYSKKIYTETMNKRELERWRSLGTYEEVAALISAKETEEDWDNIKNLLGN